MPTTLRSLWAEPRAPHPPLRVWRDWALVALLGCATALEIAVRRDIAWLPVALLEVLVLALALLWRRAHPLAAVAAAFGCITAVDVASIASNTGDPVGLYANGFLLVLPYALLRWGSGREAVIGSTIPLMTAVVGDIQDRSTVVETIAGFVILVFPSVLGASVRFWGTSRLRELDRVRFREREQLARELHDTVAHHVSAMVVRAQAGRVVAATRPGAAVEALEIIEAEGSRTLSEMRAMVGALRERDDADMTPQRGVADIEAFARSQGDEPSVEVQIAGGLDDLSPAVGAAAYRIAQESITNAMRHARHATRVDVLVAAVDDCVRVTVRDDGDGVSPLRPLDGYGTVGMMERATLLGGTLEVGPAPGRGWVVTAVLPRHGPPR